MNGQTNRNVRAREGRPGRERGAVLVVGLVLLLVLTLAGVVLARMQTVEERMARNENNHQIALQAAEAALRDAEIGIANNGCPNCFGNAGGTYEFEANTPSQADTLVSSNFTAAIATLAYSGPLLGAEAIAHKPRYVIEQLPSVATSTDPISLKQFGGGPAPTEYRVTAQGVGGDSSATVVLESIVK